MVANILCASWPSCEPTTSAEVRFCLLSHTFVLPQVFSLPQANMTGSGRVVYPASNWVKVHADCKWLFVPFTPPFCLSPYTLSCMWQIDSDNCTVGWHLLFLVSNVQFLNIPFSTARHVTPSQGTTSQVRADARTDQCTTTQPLLCLRCTQDLGLIHTHFLFSALTPYTLTCTLSHLHTCSHFTTFDTRHTLPYPLLLSASFNHCLRNGEYHFTI